jgi:hypothetical protein
LHGGLAFANIAAPWAKPLGNGLRGLGGLLENQALMLSGQTAAASHGLALAGAEIAALGGSIASLGPWAGMGAQSLDAVFSLRNPWHEDLINNGAIRKVSDYRAGVLSRPQLHHIASDKDVIYTPLFRRLFRAADMDLEHHLNKIMVPGHQGPHGVAYNLTVLRRLESAVSGLAWDSTPYKWALRSELKRIAREVVTPGSDLNLLVRFPG